MALRTPTTGYPLGTYSRDIRDSQGVEGSKVQAKSQGHLKFLNEQPFLGG